MIFGPLPVFIIDRLKERLSEFGSEYQIYADPEMVQQVQTREPSLPTLHPPFSSQTPMLYIDVPEESILLIRRELDKMAILSSKRNGQELNGEQEYVCIQCDFVSATAGDCPQHKAPLILFSESSAAIQEMKSKRLKKYFFVIASISAVIIVLATR